MTVELPTNTRKRFVLPVFGSAGNYASWNARLLDERGKVRAEHSGLRARQDLGWDSVLLGALPRTFGGLPGFPDARNNRGDIVPQVARLQLEFFPDSTIALEGLDTIYLNSEKALELKANQIGAVLGWLNGGGHLIIGVEQATDITATPWLRSLVPVSFNGVVNVACQDEFQHWLRFGGEQGNDSAGAGHLSRGRVRSNSTGGDIYRTIGFDKDFESGELPLAIVNLKEGRTLFSLRGHPVVVEANRGRGKVTVLTFSPEREPFRSWKNKGWFWARLANVPPELLGNNANYNGYSGLSLDGVFGALIDSRQVRKLPVSWLLLLLVIYLLVIGPVDQYWLKKINRQMLTWITFPCYVVLFSLLIYWIGFMLRAGESEWNELHVVDILPRGGERVELRGRTFASIYSPSNARYELAGEQPVATLRGEFLGQWAGGQESSSAVVDQRGDGFRADVFVPVWTSQLYVSDWLQPAAPPLKAGLIRKGGQLELTVENLQDHPVTNVHLAFESVIYPLGDLPARQVKKFDLAKNRSQNLTDFVRQNAGDFQYAVQQRRNTFGDNQSGRLNNPQMRTMAATFVSLLPDSNQNQYANQNNFIAPLGFDLSGLLQRGDAVLQVWDSGHAPATPALNRFTPRRSEKNTLLRLAVPVTTGTAP